jgi:hypothetical protein
MTAHPRIRVLVIDDHWLNWTGVKVKNLPPPVVSLLKERAGLKWKESAKVPYVTDDSGGSYPELSEYFEVRVLRSAKEARLYRDLCIAVSSADAWALGDRGWVPDIVVFDYALTHKDDYWPTWASSIASPLPALEQLAAKNGIRPLDGGGHALAGHAPAALLLGDLDAAGAGAFISQPNTRFSIGDDNFGCFAGALILLSFADHPCAAVPVTKKSPDKIMQSEASVLEWLLDGDFSGAFNDKPKAFGWSEVVPPGVMRLREKFKQLSACNIIRPSITDLLDLEAKKNPAVLRFTSRYGRRALPVAGLFIDIPEAAREAAVGGAAAAEGWHGGGLLTRAEYAAEWARDILTAIFRRGFDLQSDVPSGLEDLRSGLELKERLWAAYLSPQSERRYRLSELAARAAPKTGASRPGRNAARAAARPQALSEAEEAELESLRAEFKVSNSSISEEYQKQKCVDFRDFKQSYNDRARRWAVLLLIIQLEQLRRVAHAEWSTRCADAGIPQAFADKAGTERLTPNDVYLALFPIPAYKVVTPLHDDPSEYGANLRRLGGDPNRPASLHNDSENWGNLALKIDHVIGKQPKPWREEAGTDPSTWSYGLLPGEAFILQCYADDLDVRDLYWLKSALAL